jgi:hypothetical protein
VIPPTFPRLAAVLCLGWVGLLPTAAAQTAAPEREKNAEPTTLFGWRIGGLFDVDLPRFDPPGTFRLQFNPRFGDLIRRDYIRVPTGVRWAYNDRTEFYAEAEAFAAHGLANNTADGYGIGELRFGARYLFRHFPWRDYETSVGLNLEFPVGNPPRDLTDGRNHYSPYFVTQRRLRLHPKWTVFTGLSADFVSDSAYAPLNLGVNATKDHSVSLNSGAIYDLGAVKWTLQTTYTTTALAGVDEHFFTIRPSVLWWVPRKYTLNSKTQWIVGFGVRSTWGPDGYEFSTGTRVRAEITFRQAVQRLRETIDRVKQ